MSIFHDEPCCNQCAVSPARAGAGPVMAGSLQSMCGRFTQRFSWREVHTFLRLGTPGPALNLRPRYNLAPSQNAAVVRDEDGERRLSMLRWGLIPGWAKDPGIGHKLINARSETMAVKLSFRAAYSRRRCLVPADGFYEWRREGEVRQPWLIAPRDGGIVAFAGLWERWRVPEGAVLRGSLAERRSGDIVESFAILTTEANETMQALHHRMPVILAHEAGEQWLAGGRCGARPRARRPARDAPGEHTREPPTSRRLRVCRAANGDVEIPTCRTPRPPTMRGASRREPRSVHGRPRARRLDDHPCPGMEHHHRQTGVGPARRQPHPPLRRSGPVGGRNREPPPQAIPATAMGGAELLE